MSDERKQLEQQRILASRRDRLERWEAMQNPPVTATEPPTDTPIVVIEVRANGTPYLKSDLEDRDAVLLGMQALGQLALELMTEEADLK